MAWRQAGALPTIEQAVAVVRVGLPAASVRETAWLDTTREEIVGTPGPGALPGERHVVVSTGTVSRADVAAARDQLARAGWQVSGDDGGSGPDGYSFTARRGDAIAEWTYATDVYWGDGAAEAATPVDPAVKPTSVLEVYVGRRAPVMVLLSTVAGWLLGLPAGWWLARRLRRTDAGPARRRSLVAAIVVTALLALPTLAVLTETVTTLWRPPGSPVEAL